MRRQNAIVIRILLALATPSLAAEKEGWELTGAAGLSYSDGNSDSAAYSVQVLASYLDDDQEAYLGADWFYAQNNGVKSTDSLKFFGQYNRTLEGNWYAGGRASYFQDQVAAIDHRVDTGILLGHHLIKNERAKLSLEAGPGYAWQERGGIESNFATLRFAERFEYRFTETTHLWQSLAWTPRVDKFSESILDFELGLETRVTDNWSLRTFVRHRIDSAPAAGRGREDTALIFGAAYDFSGVPGPEESASGRRSLMPDEEEDAEDSPGFHLDAALGFTLNKGNSDSIGARLAANLAFRDDDRELLSSFTQTFSEDNGATSTDRTTVRFQQNKFHGERSYFGEFASYLRDSPADIDYRIISGLLGGYKLIKTDDTTLAIEVGPSYTFEKVGRSSDNYFSLFAAERFSHKFNSRMSFSQSITYNAEVADLDKFNIVAGAALNTKLSHKLIWRLGADYTYENQPAALRGHHDTTLISSVAVQF